MIRKLLNTILLANGISSLDENKETPKEDKWAARREKYGERPWEEQQPKTADDNGAEPDAGSDTNTD